jgi:hypothetical protein
VPGSLHLGDIGADGSVLAWQQKSRSLIVGRGPGDIADRDLSWLDYSTMPKLSSDGKQLVFSEEGDGGGVNYSVYVRPTDGGPAVRLGPGMGTDMSPDGKWVLSVRINPPPSQFVLLPTGAGEPRVLTNDELSHEFGNWMPDGKRLVFEAFAPGRPKRLYVQDATGGPARPITPEGVVGPLSPDGTLVASDGKLYPVGSSGSPRPIPGIEVKDRIERWASDSKALYVRQSPKSKPQSIFRLDVATGKRTLLHEIPFVPGATSLAWFTITPDGSAYVGTFGLIQGDLYRVTGLR